jgi:hypothetical protein
MNSKIRFVFNEFRNNVVCLHRLWYQLLKTLHYYCYYDYYYYHHHHHNQLSRCSDGLWTKRPGFDSQQKQDFLFATASRPALGPTQPPIQWVPGALSLAVKRPGRDEADYSPHLGPRSRIMELYRHSPIRLHGVVLNKLSSGTILPSTLSLSSEHLFVRLWKILATSRSPHPKI